MNKRLEEELEQSVGQSIIETPLGFRDITIALRDRTLEEIKKYDVIRKVWIKSEKKESHQGKIESIYNFVSDELRIEGRIFPFDEILTPESYCDIIVQNWKDERDINLDANPYHNFYKGEELYVRVANIKEREDPSFKLFNRITGFIKDSGNAAYEKIKVGDPLAVKVHILKKAKHGLIIEALPVKFL